MRGVDLSIFDFDYDLQWYAFMLDADGATLGRFGGREPDEPAKYQTLAGLRHSLEAALKRFKNETDRKLTPRKPIRPEEYPAAEKRAENKCIHCHHVNEFRRDALQRAGKWSLDEVWMYPQPENIGLTLDPDNGARVLAVDPKSQAHYLGVRARDIIQCIGGAPIASVADVQHALHRGPKKGSLSIGWKTPMNPHSGVMDLKEGWRKSDVSWRWSLKSLSPNPGIIGDDLGIDERKKLGLDTKQLAYRQINFLTPTARHAGLQANDVIVGIDDKTMSMTARQFETHIRLYYRVGDEITLNVIRGKERVKVKLKLPE